VTRVAAIDLGTNATRLLVADVDGDEVIELVRRTRITRLGEGVDARRRLLPLPIARVRNVLADYRREAEELGAERVLAVATSAVRDAENGEAFLGEVEWSYGFATRLLSGDEEAAMTLRGVGPLDPGTVVVDVGGGSTELIAAGFRASLDIGCVRLTERHGHDLDAIAEAVRAALPELSASRAIGVDGTTAELAALGGNGSTVTLATIDEALSWLARSSEEERRARLLQPDRSEVLAAGVIVLRETLRRLGLTETSASERDLLNGAALAAAELPAPAEGAAPPGAHTCCQET
jgi:exopolyphosphatase/guanosine-5'-triphosphate,3'-diphosphate pyrophosphatase